jgi:hypothetical protein
MVSKQLELQLLEAMRPEKAPPALLYRCRAKGQKFKKNRAAVSETSLLHM